MTDDIYSMTKSGFHEALREAKEQAFDEGYKTAMFDKEYYSHNPNPHRSRPVAEQPTRTICETCGGDGSQGNDCTCPGWIAVDDLAHADLKALLANDDLSLGVPREKEL